MSAVDPVKFFTYRCFALIQLVAKSYYVGQANIMFLIIQMKKDIQS